MKVFLASTNKDKISAVNLALSMFYSDYSITPVQTDSNVNEQPIGNETIVGVKNRTHWLMMEHSDSYDCLIAIENGLFIENGQFVDRAVVQVTFKDKPTIIKISDGVIFPMKYVEMTSNCKGGFIHNTVGEIMEEDGFVVDESDPHKSICGKTRVEFIKEALMEALEGD